MKLLAYSRWHLDANDKFYEAVGLPSSAEYGKSRWADNIMIERWFRSFKYEEAYLTQYNNIKEARTAIRTVYPHLQL